MPKIQERLGLTGLRPGGPDTANELGRQFRSVVVNRSGGARPGARAAFAYWKDYLFGLAQEDSGGSLAQEPGRVATNLFTRYGPDRPVDVNATVQRVPPVDRRARATRSLTPVASVAGRPSVPVVSLHNLGDLFVPFSMERRYRADAARHGRADLVTKASQSPRELDRAASPWASRSDAAIAREARCRKAPQGLTPRASQENTAAPAPPPETPTLPRGGRPRES